MAKQPADPNDPSLAGGNFPPMTEADMDRLTRMWMRMEESEADALLEGAKSGFELLDEHQKSQAQVTGLADQREQLKENIREEFSNPDDPDLFQ